MVNHKHTVFLFSYLSFMENIIFFRRGKPSCFGFVFKTVMHQDICILNQIPVWWLWHLASFGVLALLVKSFGCAECTKEVQSDVFSHGFSCYGILFKATM